MAIGVQQQQRRGTAAEWNTSDYVLAAGELGVTTDTGIIKIGDGVNGWTDLNPAFGSQYLPLLGKAADSELLDGISSGGFYQLGDATTAATADKLVKRLSDGRAKAVAGSASDDVVNFLQMNNADTAAIAEGRKMLISRNLTDATTTFALLLADIGTMITVTNNSLTAQRLVTIPLNSSVAFPVGSCIDICNTGAGNLKLSPAGGVTLLGTPHVFGNFSVVRLIKTGTDIWLASHLSNKNQTRLPTIRAVRTGSSAYVTNSYIFVPYDSIDTTKTFNPDNEWFSVPGTGLPTARRIIVNKDGLYSITHNFITAASPGAGPCFNTINKMTADNSHTGETWLATTSMFVMCSLSVSARFAAGESVGAAHSTLANAADVADGGFAGYRNDFTITRVSD